MTFTYMASARMKSPKSPAPASKETKMSVPEKPVVAISAEAPRAAAVELLRGVKDILPSEQAYWAHLRSLVETIAQQYGFSRIDTPVIEDPALFHRAIGEQSEVVAKELYAFTDPEQGAVALRPEGTAGVARAYIEHGMANQPQPIKLWYFGPMFRFDRPQAGRLRQFHQFGLEILGELHPATDAELLTIGANCFRRLGIPITVQVNSVGCRVCRPPYLQELEGYWKTHRTELCEECKQYMGTQPLRCFSCRVDGCRALQESAPQMVDWLCEECKQHFIRVLEYLDELEIPYALAPFLVRGFAYYTKTVFEFLPVAPDGTPVSASPLALAAGGRYDGLVESLGGRPTPATGLSFGCDRIMYKMREAVSEGRLVAPAFPTPAIYLAQLGDQAKRKAMRLYEELLAQQFTVAAHFSKDALKAQLEYANALNTRLTLILGQKEVIDGTIIIREMSSGIQEIIAYEKVVPEVRKRLEQEAVRESKTEVVPSEVTEGAPEQERGARWRRRPLPEEDAEFEEPPEEAPAEEETPADPAAETEEE
ncbi:histidine--tRNA ligase [Candidatus Uhrbacteria bacterium]|nr:histidine--tRNA ligase [Candidatus Uhrbacteria bacterium]